MEGNLNIVTVASGLRLQCVSASTSNVDVKLPLFTIMILVPANDSLHNSINNRQLTIDDGRLGTTQLESFAVEQKETVMTTPIRNCMYTRRVTLNRTTPNSVIR